MSPRLLALFGIVGTLAACGDSASSDAGGANAGGASTGGGPAHGGGAAAGGAPTQQGGGGGSQSDGGAQSTGGAASGGGPMSYATDFDADESPISENGAWSHVGLDWTLVDTAGGVAYGTQTGNGGYDDSYAVLSGFPPDQSASAIIHRDAVIDGNCTHEVEILLRWSDADHDARGYECNLAYDGSYAQIVRWNGPFGDFTYLGSGSVPGGVSDGDTISATAVGDVITLYVNGVQVATATDGTHTTGNPGMGFWRGGPCISPGDYGFTHYEAASMGP